MSSLREKEEMRNEIIVSKLLYATKKWDKKDLVFSLEYEEYVKIQFKKFHPRDFDKCHTTGRRNDKNSAG